jgi:hypothetical protein
MRGAAYEAMRARTARPFSIALLALLAASVARAQDLDALMDTTPRERATVQTLMMREKLGLTPAEASKVEPINLKDAEAMEPVKDEMRQQFAQRLQAQRAHGAQ